MHVVLCSCLLCIYACVFVNADDDNDKEIVAASTATPLSVIIVILAAIILRDYLRRRRDRRYRRQMVRNRSHMQLVHDRTTAPAGGRIVHDRTTAPAGGRNDDDELEDDSFVSFDEDATAVKGKSYESVVFGPPSSAPAASVPTAGPSTVSAFRPTQVSTPTYANVELHAPPTRAPTPLSASHSRASTPHYENVELRPMPAASTLSAAVTDQAEEQDSTITIDLSEVETADL